MHRRALLLLAVSSLTAFRLVGQSDDKPPPTPYDALYREWKADHAALESESEERQTELRKQYTQRFFKLAQTHARDDTWLSCLMWGVTKGVPGPELDGMVEVARRRARFVDNQTQLQLFMAQLVTAESSGLGRALSEIAESHPSKGVRGGALYAFAARTKRLAERDGSVKQCEESKLLLRRVVAEYPAVRTYHGKNKDNAERLLEELRGPVAIGMAAPETKGKSLDGASFDLSEHRGKVVVLSFSGHWCGPCRAMHPVLKRLLDRKDMAVIEVNSDEPRNLQSVRAKAVKDGLRWLHVADGRSGPLAKLWSVSVWPTYYVLDREHTIRRRVVGYVGDSLLEWVEQTVKVGVE